ncbi:adhesin isopeptide-forming adherence domain protein [Bifidobacterium saguini DSM 23967]|uniref:Adhesin isopeptide-forming adherence domain protein n=1 Tax=Bifidobacterium saguini DSM 23967 TaxID=1437607 RepID=A0A087D6V2_9BIFI|nr:LPXTG cell wall anchor domain-containing protein [Bifidobacterium saguini]KFI91252.1 adhesin isopeptide-forming adherence domain protein [Bifidobacterium saguini DSM 23967]
MGFNNGALGSRSHEPSASVNGKRNGVRRTLAAAAAVATLASGGLVAATAYAGGGGGNAGGGGVTADGNFNITWQYSDNDNGGFGPASDWHSTENAVKLDWYTLGGNAETLIEQATTEANDNCLARFDESHPDQKGQGQCRVVGVGVVGAANTRTWNGIGGATHKLWMKYWHQVVDNVNFSNNGSIYTTATEFTDQAGWNVDKIADTYAPDYKNDASTGSIVVIALNQYEPRGEQPPSPPSKTIEKGTSADSMANETVISTGTGRLGTKMTISDTIDPNGMAYTVTGQKVIDTTDGNKDVSGQFTFNTKDGEAAPDNVATATWNGGDLPDSHTFEYHLTITVSQPSTSKVVDTPSVTWNDKGTGDVDSHEFPTWEPNPDKSWIKYSDGKWQAVIDPDETNATGADNVKLLDGDIVGSAVNATVDGGLKEAPKSLTITDDWTNADYLVDRKGDIKVYAAAAEPDTTETVEGVTVKHMTKTSVADIANKGLDVTSSFDITENGTVVTASAKKAYLAKLKGMSGPIQLTVIVPFVANFANGKGAEQVREDFGKQPGDELTFCTNPTDAKDESGQALTNKGAETVNDQTVPTNEPKICGYVPKVEKDVVAESSQGGDQDSVDGKTVYPGQKVEYQLDTQPNLPADLAYLVKNVVFTDTYDQYLTPDKQTVEMMDLATGKVVSKKKYETKWDEENHLFQLTVTDQDLIGQWKAGANPRIQIRFEGTVAEDAPTDHKVNNRWMLTLNNSLTPSNEVFNLPPDFTPKKDVTQSAEQGDPTISIDGKTLLLGDTGYYKVSIDATRKDNAYKVWRLGAVDDYDEKYLTVDPSRIEIIGADGKDYTKAFNIQLQDGIVYAFARTVDTEIPATGETVKGDPQPADLKAYSEMTDKDYDPLKDPSIDQSLLGQEYTLTIPYTVSKVDDGYVVKNTATQIVNNVKKETNTVSNPLKPINPVKDVTVKVGGESVDGKSIYLDSTFLYQLDSSVIPADRAYQQVANWGVDDQLDPAYDELTGQWAVYAARDLYQDGNVIAKKGERIAGSGFDSSKLGGDLFTATLDKTTGKVTITATQTYLDLVSKDTAHEQAWRAYLQVKRVKVTDRHENVFTEHYNGKALVSNIVWTRTPDLTPSLNIEKWDKKSGFPAGDRDDSKDALKGAKDGDVIVFTITNTSKDEDGHGAWFKASDLKLTDQTIVGDGTVTDLKYPSNWDTLVLKPGDHVDVEGTLTGFTSANHTDRAKVTGTPLVSCPATDANPFGGQSDDSTGSAGETTGLKQVTIDGQTRCEDTKVESNTDDWNGVNGFLSTTGAGILPVVIAAIALLVAGGVGLVLTQRRGMAESCQPAHSAK